MKKSLLTLVMLCSVLFAMAQPETPTIESVEGLTSWGLNTEYQFKATSPDGASLFGWSVDGESTGYTLTEGTTMSSTLAIKFTEAGTYTLQCTTMDFQGQSSEAATFEVEVGSLSYSVDPITMCEEESLPDIHVYVTGGEAETGDYRVLIDPAYAFNATTGGTELTFTFTNVSGIDAGTHTVKFMNPQEEIFAATTLEVISVEQPEIESAATEYYVGNTYDFSIANASSSNSYQWIFDGTTETGEFADVTLTSTGSFVIQVEATDGNGCKASSSKEITVEDPLSNVTFSAEEHNVTYGETPYTFNVTASEELTKLASDYYFILVLQHKDNSSLVSSYHSSSIDGTGITFKIDENGTLESGTYNVVAFLTKDSTGLELNGGLLNVNVQPVCELNGTRYMTLSDAMSASLGEGQAGEIRMLADAEESSLYVYFNDLVLDLNGHTVSAPEFSAYNDEKTTITIKNGDLQAYISCDGGTSDTKLLIDNATVTARPAEGSIYAHTSFNWKGGEVEIANNGTLEVQDSAYFGCDEGFTLTIDATSKLVVDNQNGAIVSYCSDTTVLGNQFRQYIQDDHTVEVEEGDGGLQNIVFSPDASLTLSNPNPPLVTVSFPKSSYTLTAGDSVQVCVTITSDDENFSLDNVTVSFSYEEAEVAFISVENEPTCTYIRALPGGSWAQVTATVTYDGVEYYGTTEVNINAAPLALESPKSNLEYEDGGTYQMKVNEWFESDYYNFVWTSSDENVATVDGSGLVTYVSSGTVTISCEATNKYDGEDVQTASCDLTIEKPITYSAETQEVCLADSYEYTVTASEDLTDHTSDFILVLQSDEMAVPLVSSFHSTSVNGNTISFIVSGISGITYDISLFDGKDSSNLVLNGGDGNPQFIPKYSNNPNFYVNGETYIQNSDFREVPSIAQNQVCSFEVINVYDGESYTWTVVGDNTTYVFTDEISTGSSVSISFPDAGSYTVTCTSRLDECPESQGNASNSLDIEVSSPVCEINGNQYVSLSEAMRSFSEGQTDGEIRMLSDSEEEELWTSADLFVLDLNGYTVTANSMLLASATIKNGTLQAYISSSDATSDMKLGIDNATVSAVPSEGSIYELTSFDWRGGEVEIAHNGTLEVQDSAYFGCDEGFTLTIDATSKLVVNNQNGAIVSYCSDTTMLGNQFRQYIQDDHTVKVEEGDGGLQDIVFSPDAILTLSNPTPITYTVEPTTFCEGDEDMTITITASEATSYSVKTSDGSLMQSVVEETELTYSFNGLPAGTHSFSIVQDGETVDEFTVTVNSLASVEISCPSDGDAVVGNTWTFTNSSATTGSSETLSYEWASEQISFTDATSQSQEVTFETSGSASVDLTVTDANECSNTVTCSFTIIEYTIDPMEFSLYVGETQQLVLYADGEAYTGTDVTWVVNTPVPVDGDGVTSTTACVSVDDNGLVTAVATGDAEIQAKVNGTVVAYATVSVDAVTFTVADNKFCLGAGGNVTITADVELDAGALVVQDADGGSIETVITGTTATIEQSKFTTSGTYTIIYNDVEVSTFDVTVNSLPSVEISCPSESDAVVGSTWTFTNGSATTGSSETLSYEWASEQISFANAVDETQEVTFETAGPAAVSLTVTDANECSNTATCTFTIEEGTTYSVPETTTVCSGQAAGITITASKEVTADDITIKRENGSEISSIDVEGTTITLGVGAGTYYVYESGKTDAVATFSVVEEDMYVELDGATEVTLPGTATYTASSLEGATYRWSCSDATIAQSESITENAETVAITFPKTGSYTVKATATSKNGCAATEELEVNVSVDPSAISVSFDKAGYELTIGTDTTICLNVDGLSATDYTVSYSYGEEYMSLTEQESNTLCQTVSPLAAGSTMLEASVAYAGETFTASAVITVAEATQTYTVNGGEEVTWCHGAESGHVAFTVTSNMDIPESLTVNHEWASNIQVDVYGKEANVEFDYPYCGRQAFDLVVIESGDTVTVAEVNAFGRGHMLADFPENQDSVLVFTERDTLTLNASGNVGSTSGSGYTALGSTARFYWSVDNDAVTQECIEAMVNEGEYCSASQVRFTFPQVGTYNVGFVVSESGCTSDEVYKTIYVVDFDPALFSISPEKDTIEIGDADGVQLTLKYNSEDYAGEYTLRTDGDLTIDGSTVYDNEITGTFEVNAIVSDLVVAKAWITVNEVPITYTVDNVSVCEGTDEAEAIIYASGSIEGKTVTVRDEDGNTLYPEYNDNNDAATVHLSYLSVGTYRYKVYENDVYKTEFTVTVNSLPSAYIECPKNPVVGDTWTPNTAMAEGLTYQWWSEDISSLDGTTSCCPTVTFTEAGTFSATLVVKNNETGCLSEGITCEFTVEEPVSYVKVFETYYNEYGTCVDGDGISDIWYRRGDNLGNEFTIAAQDAGVDDWGSAPQVGESFTVFMKGTANFTGKVSLFIVDERQEANYWAELTPYASEFYVAEGQQFEYEGLLKITNTTGIGSNNENVDLINPNFQIVCLPDVTSTQAGFDDTKVLNLSLTDYSMTYSEGSQQNVCDGNSVAFTHSTEESGGSTIHVYELVREVNIENPSTEDSFELEWAYTSNFTAKSIDIALVDLSQGNPTPYVNPDVTWSSFYLTEGEQMTRTMVFSLPANITEKSTFAIAAFITSNEEFDNPTLCESEFIFKKQGEIVQECTNYELDGENSVQLQYLYNGDNIAVGDTYNYEVFGTAQFTGDLFFSLVDQSEEVGYWDMLADSKLVSVVEGESFEIKGSFTVTKEPTSKTPAIYFTVGRVDVNQSGEIKTICVLNSAIYKSNGGDECYNKIVVDGGNSAVLNGISDSQVSVGDVYEYYVSGTADFTGEAMVSFADASEDADYYFALAEPVTFNVTEGESFSQRGTFVVKNQTPSEYPDFSLMIAKNNGVTGESSSFCIDGAYIEKQVQSYTMSESEVNMFVGGTKYIYLLGDGQPYSGYVEWGVTDLSGSTTPCVTVDDGEIIANNEGQAQIYAKVHDQVVATAIVTITSFSCDGGELYTVANNDDSPFMIYPLSGIAAGDSYKVTINGKTDYDGVIMAAIADFSAASEEGGPAQGSNIGELMVKAGQEFSYNTILTVAPSTASAPEYKMIFVFGGSEELDEFKLCATQLSVDKFTVQYTIEGTSDMYVDESNQLTIKNIDGTVYGGDAQWVSTDETVVSVANNGYVYAKSEGVAEVQVIIGGDIAATALINVEKATGVSIGLDKPGYEIENVGDEQIVYINAVGLQAATFSYQYDESIIEVTPIQGTNTLLVKGLKVGSTHLFVTATLDGESHEAGAVVEVGGSTSNDYTLAFAQSKYEITEGESISACLTIGEGFKEFQPQLSYDDAVISIAEPTDDSDCATVTALKAGQTTVVLTAEANGETYTASTEVIVHAKSSEDYLLAFSQSKYEITEGESLRACLQIGDGFKEFQPQLSYDDAVISIAEPTDDSDCATVTALKAGQTTITLTAEANGETYTASTEVIVHAKSSEDYLLAFEQSKYELTEGESLRACLQIGDGFKEFQPQLSYDDAVISIAEPTDDSDCATVTALKAGQTTITLTAEANGETYTASTEVIVNTADLPQVEAPSMQNDIVTLCYGKDAFSDDAMSLDQYVAVTTDNGSLKWYDAAGNVLAGAPVIDSKTVGKRIYYVSQVATGYSESEKLPFTVNIVYVAAPELNIYEQKICDDANVQAFVAKTTNNVVWYDAEMQEVSQDKSFIPSATGTYTVVATESSIGCTSVAAQVSYMVGRTATPVIISSKTEYALGESVELSVENVDAELFGVVWDVEGTTMQGESISVASLAEGSHTIVCRSIDKESGCFDTSFVQIEVKNTNIPVTAISVDPQTVSMYTGEKQQVGISFEPSFATNQKYVVTIADPNVAVVSGSTIFASEAGETTITIASAENPDIAAEISVTVQDYIAARSISLPKIITMAVGDVTKVNASVLPANASKNTVYFMEKTDISVVKVLADGTIEAKGEGTAVINAYTEGGLQASSVVYVTSNVEEITSIEVPERVEMKQGDSVSVPVKVTPTTLLVKDLTWTIGDNTVISFENGVLKALKKGETTLSVSYKDLSKTVTIVVNASSAPVATEIPQVAMNQNGTASVDLSMYVSDENGFENLTVTTVSENFNVTIEDGVLTVTPKESSYTGTDTVLVTVTNEEGLSTVVDMPIVVKESENKAPVVKLHEILFKESDRYKFFNLSDIAEDDMTEWNNLKFTFNVHRNGANNQQTILPKIMKKTQVRVVKMLNFEQDSIFVTVSDGVNVTVDTILVYVGSIPNKAPIVSEIPVQNESDTAKFGTIDLAKYVTDDYTTPAAMAWTASSSENISVSITNGIASATVLNEFWRGAEAITFVAKDEEGAADSTVVYYVRNVTIQTEDETPEPGEDIVAVWEGAPTFDIMAMRSIGVPGDSYVLMASLFGFNGTFEWTIDNAEGITAGSLMQTVTFAEPGEYDVTLTIRSADGQYEKSLTKEKLLKVVGIDNRNPEICKGQPVTLNATEGMDSYYWTSGDAKASATVRPGETTTVAVTMKQGLFTFVDSVRVVVSVPVTLMEDSVMCKGTTFDLEAQGEFVSYTWNTGESTPAITIPDMVETYSVMTVDNMNCVSVDTFNLTKVNDLPVINLGEDQTPCDGMTVTLDAGEGFEYLWSTNSTEQTIDLTAGTDTVWARIIDANKCINYDTVVVAFTYPYPEKLGVATFSETTNHIILAWEKTADVNTVSYRIERETDVTDNWEKVGEDVMFAEAGIVVDEDVNYKQRAYKYRLVTTDGCGNEAISEVHRSMISTTTNNDDGTKTLQWCAYEPMSNVTQYLVLRGYDATAMDTVDKVPASNLYEIWNETDSKYVEDKDIKYRVVFRLKSEINENAVNTLEGKPFEGYYTKAESGPFSLAMSNIAEAENTESVDNIAFPAEVLVYPSVVKDVINVVIASQNSENFTVEVLNSNGQVMSSTQTGEIEKTMIQIRAAEFTQGIYNVKISTNDQVKVLKVVK